MKDFIVDLEDRSVDLLPRQGYVVPRGVVHRTRAPERSVILMVETASIVPTGSLKARDDEFAAGIGFSDHDLPQGCAPPRSG